MSFVTTNGSNFIFNNKNFYFSGTNCYNLFTFGNENNKTEIFYINKTKIDNHMETMKSYGVNVLKDVLDIATRNFDNDWTKTLYSSSLGKILFTNGYYDFHKGQFFKFTDKDYDHTIIFIEQISHDYIPLKDETYIASVKQRLFSDPFGEDVADYYILNIARGLAGDVMKRVLFCIGDSNTGKSSISNVIKFACGGYSGTFTGDCIATKKMTSGCARVASAAISLTCGAQTSPPITGSRWNFQSRTFALVGPPTPTHILHQCEILKLLLCRLRIFFHELG